MAFPNTPVLDAFPSDLNPLNGTGGWSASHTTTSAPSNLQASSGTAISVSSYGSAVWPTAYAGPMEFYATKQNSFGDDYWYWMIQPGTENGSGTLDGYYIHVPTDSATTAEVYRSDNDTGTLVINATSITHVAGDQWGISLAADGTITLYQNGVVRGTPAVDATYASGYLGLVTNWTSAGGIDNMGGGQTLSAPKAIQDWRRNAFPMMGRPDRRQFNIGRANASREARSPGPMGGFERFLAARFHVAPPATTHFGEASLTATFTATTAGQKLVTGASSSDWTMTIAAAGVRVGTGVSSSTYTFSATTAARVTAKAATSSTYTFSKASAGIVTAKSATSSTYTFSATTAGGRKTFGATSLPIVLTVTTNSLHTLKGASSTAIVFGATTNGTVGAGASMTINFAATTAGHKTTFGVVSRTTTVGVTTAGSRFTTGASSLHATFTAVTNGTRKTFSAVSVPIVFSATTTGARDPVDWTGSTSLTITLATSTAGNRVHYGTATLPIMFSAATAGIRATSGQVSLVVTFAANTDGTPPVTLEEVVTGWIAQSAMSGGIGGGARGRISQPVGGGIE